MKFTTASLIMAALFIIQFVLRTSYSLDNFYTPAESIIISSFVTLFPAIVLIKRVYERENLGKLFRSYLFIVSLISFILIIISSLNVFYLNGLERVFNLGVNFLAMIFTVCYKKNNKAK